MEDIAFGDWPGQQMDLNGSNHPWLPAYGFQQPILEKDDFLGSPDAALFLNGGGTHQYVFLETIMEETSDDLRSSDSERSTSCASHDDDDEDDEDRHQRLGWLASDSESGSVIQVNVTSVDDGQEAGVDSDNEDSSSECDIVCPAKRRRRHENNHLHLLTIPNSDEDLTSLPSLSRSSSLLQFEALEKRCQEDMYNSSPSILSTFSYDSLEIQHRNNIKNQRLSPDSLNNRSTDTDEDDGNDTPAEESDCGDYYRTLKIDKTTNKRSTNTDSLFYKTRIISKSDASSSTDSDDTIPSDETIHHQKIKYKNRSFESLFTSKKMSTENLSEDSGYCDQHIKKTSSIPNFEIIPESNNFDETSTAHDIEYSTKKSNFGAYDCETTLFPTRTVAHFGTSYHDLSIFDPNKITVQFKNNLQKLGKYHKNLKQNPNIELIEEIDELERETQSLKLEIVLPQSKFSSTQAQSERIASTSEPNLLSAVDSEHLSALNNIHQQQLNFCTNCDLISSSVPQNLNLISNNETDIVTSSPWNNNNVDNSVALKNIDLSVINNKNSEMSSSRDMISTDNNTIRIRLKDDTPPPQPEEVHRTVIGVEDNSSFTLNDGVTKLLDVTADNRCYNLDIHSDILDFESTIQKAISNSSIPSFKDKGDFFFHSTPMTQPGHLRTPSIHQSTPNLSTIFATEKADNCKTVPLKKIDADSYMKGLSGSEGKNIGGGILHRNSLAGSGSTTKGVHFCEIVSEVSWREQSYSSENSFDDEDEANQTESSESLDEIMLKVAEQIEEKDGSSYLIKDYMDKDGFTYKHSHMLNANEVENTITPTLSNHVTASSGEQRDGVSKIQRQQSLQQQEVFKQQQQLSNSNNDQQCRTVNVVMMDNTNGVNNQTIVDQQSTKKREKKLGGFLSRFTNFRFSTRNKTQKSKTNNASTTTTVQPEQKKFTSTPIQRNNNDQQNGPDYIYIPLKGPSPTPPSGTQQQQHHDIFSKVMVDGKPLDTKPPLPKQPPRVIGASVKQQQRTGNNTQTQRSSNIITNGGSNIDSTVVDGCILNNRNVYSNNRGGAALISSCPTPTVDNRHATINNHTNITSKYYQQHNMEQHQPLGLIETDLDTHITVVNSSVSNNNNNNGQQGGKARSLMNLPGDNNSCVVSTGVGGDIIIQPVLHHLGDSGTQSTGLVRPHKSMEFLLDKQNLKVVEPPENELQKGGTGERVMSEHQLRVQRSLQKLNVPEWFKQSHVPREGFLLKKQQRENTKWSGLSGKTTSLSSLGGSRQSPILLSPSPQGTGGQIGGFTRWSTSKLNSTASSPCNSTRSSFNYRQPITGLTANGTTSPCSSTRSSFNYRQPYLGWRSQERLTKPRTPAERLASSLLPPAGSTTANNSEIQSSIKEVTSAIVHYVSGLTPDTNPTDSLHVMSNSNRRESSDRESMSTSPRFRDYETQETASQRSISPASRGSQKFCWLESSFVGTRPLDSPQTPMGIPTDASSEISMDTVRSTHYPALHLDLKTKNSVNPTGSCYSYANSSSSSLARPAVTRPSPGSTTLEDVLDSLLGLPPSTRAPSPSLQGMGSANSSPGHFIGEAIGSNRDRLLSVGSNSTHYDSIRRRSEGNTMQPKPDDDPQRRVSFHTTPESGQIDLLTSNFVKCRYTKCTNQATHEHAKKYFKNCHNCNYSYCSRECRRAHWEKHRKTCLHSRASTLCRQILAKAKDDPESLNHISVIARRGYLSLGPGVVKCFFASPEAAERFIEHGLQHLSEPTYIRWSDLLPSEMGPELFSELVKICKSYNPDTRVVLYVAVCVVSEVPSSGTIKWERQLVSRCAKLRLSKSALSVSNQQISNTTPHRSKSPCNITREMDNPETLILTSLPGNKNQTSVQKSREISFTNIQRQLKQRGVSLRRHFPDVYQKLCAYVEGASDKFAPVTVYPRDSTSGKSFMCIIMPDVEPEKLDLVPTDCSRVHTVDVSQEHPHE